VDKNAEERMADGVEEVEEVEEEGVVEEWGLTEWQLRSLFVTSGNDFVNVGENK